MACSYINCKVKSNSEQQLMCCWLCDTQAHASCAGFNGRQFDMLTDRSNGLRWSCVNCRTLDIDFYRMFRDAKLSIERMKSDFSAGMANLNKMESLFDKFEYIETSPKRKRASKNDKSINTSTLPNTTNLISLLSPVCGNNDAQETLPSGSNSAQISAAGSIKSAPSLQADGIQIDSATTPATNASAINSTSAVETSHFGGQKVVHNLVVVPPRKTVFLSRLASDTTIKDIGDFIRTNDSSIGEDFTIFKFNYSQQRDISSFKISIPGKFFDVVVNKSFWPDGVLVREFEHRERNRSGGLARLLPDRERSRPAVAASLPPTITVSKN